MKRWIAPTLAALCLAGPLAARADTLPPAEQTTPDILGDPAAAPPPPADAERPARRSDLPGVLTDDESARLRAAGKDAEQVGREVGQRLQAQAATLALLIDQLKPTPEEQARLKALIEEQKLKLRDQLQDFQRDLREIRPGL